MKTGKALMTSRNVRRGVIAAASFLAIGAFCHPASVCAQAQGTTTTGAFGSRTLGSTSGASAQGLGQGMTQGMNSGATQSAAGMGNNSAATPSGATNMQNLQAGGATGFIGQSSQNNAQNFYA